MLLASIDEEASAEVVAVPLLLLGLGIGALASQLGSVTVSSVPDELSAEVGGIQNTATNIGRVAGNRAGGVGPDRQSHGDGRHRHRQEPPQAHPTCGRRRTWQLAGGVPFLSDADLEAALAKAGVTDDAASAIVEENATPRLRGLRAALAVIAIVAARALLFCGRIPTRQPGSDAVADEARAAGHAANARLRPIGPRVRHPPG